MTSLERCVAYIRLIPDPTQVLTEYNYLQPITMLVGTVTNLNSPLADQANLVQKTPSKSKLAAWSASIVYLPCF